jgi:hypothetical protein
MTATEIARFVATPTTSLACKPAAVVFTRPREAESLTVPARARPPRQGYFVRPA